MKNVLIIGNGFDLDLGLPTRYSDFAHSEKYWPYIDRVPDRRNIFSQVNGLQYHSLALTLNDKRDKENWFDIEEILRDYAQNEVAQLARDLYSAKDDIEYFEIIKSKLCDYLIDVQNSTPINTNALAGDILRAVLNNGYFDNIFSFNYTDLNYLTKQLGINKPINYTHVHGKLSDRSIILGVNEVKLKDEYEEFHKSTSEFYRSNNLTQALAEANEVIFYGLSFGLIDFDYFSNFFKVLNDKMIPEKEKKHISIFTKNVASGKDIIKRLRDAGINQYQLRSNSYFNLYYCESPDETELRGLYKRLNESSRETHNRTLRSIASQIH